MTFVQKQACGLSHDGSNRSSWNGSGLVLRAARRIGRFVHALTRASKKALTGRFFGRAHAPLQNDPISTVRDPAPAVPRRDMPASTYLVPPLPFGDSGRHVGE